MEFARSSYVLLPHRLERGHLRYTHHVLGLDEAKARISPPIFFVVAGYSVTSDRHIPARSTEPRINMFLVAQVRPVDQSECEPQSKPGQMSFQGAVLVNYHDDIYGPEVHEVGPHVVSCMLYIQVIAKA